MALKFLNKKGWHTGSLRNIENVWKAEQKHKAEEKKLEQLRKQIHDERERAEFRLLQEQAGLVSSQERLEFLYDSGLAVGKSGSDGGTFKALDPSLPKPDQPPSSSSLPIKSNAPGALFEEKPHSANDLWRKLHSDPLLVIRQREQEALARVKNNPVKMATIRKSICNPRTFSTTRKEDDEFDHDISDKYFDKDYNRSQERLEFLYDLGLVVGKSGSDGGTFKALDPSLPKSDQPPSSSSLPIKSNAPGALFEEKPQSANDLWRKLHSDPLLVIRQREQEALARVKNNPVKMAAIRKSICNPRAFSTSRKEDDEFDHDISDKYFDKDYNRYRRQEKFSILIHYVDSKYEYLNNSIKEVNEQMKEVREQVKEVEERVVKKVEERVKEIRGDMKEVEERVVKKVEEQVKEIRGDMKKIMRYGGIAWMSLFGMGVSAILYFFEKIIFEKKGL